jgi:hypothetical protein
MEQTPVSRVRDADSVEYLRKLVLRGIVDQIGMREEHALPFADAVLGVLMSQHGGEKLYVPCLPRRTHVDKIAEYLRIEGHTVAGACRTFNVSRRTLQRMFPDGVKAAKRAAAGKKTPM